jgi:D-lactate dehydrogenase
MLDTCATTGLCAIKCPVNINTADLVLSLNQQNKTWVNYLYVKFATKYFALWMNFTNKAIKYTNLFANLIGKKRLNHATQSLHKKYKIIPVYPTNMPKHQTFKFKTEGMSVDSWASDVQLSKHKNHSNYSRMDNDQSNNLYNENNEHPNRKVIIYIPTCPNQIFAESKISEAKLDKGNQRHHPYQLATLNIANHLGYKIIIPHNIKNLCCGQLLNNKPSMSNINNSTNPNSMCNNNACSSNHQKQSSLLLQEIKNTVDLVLAQNSMAQHSDISVVIDNTSCYHYFLSQLNTQESKVKIITSIEFIFNALPQLPLIQKFNNVILHIDCSSIKLSLAEQIRQIVSKCTRNITEPDIVNCCGFAGAKGFTIPELNQAAIKHMQIKNMSYDVGVSGNRNCQIGLAEYIKVDFISVAEMVNICLCVDLQESKPPLQFPHI